MKSLKEFKETDRVYTPKELAFLQQIPIRKIIRQYSDERNSKLNKVEKSKKYEIFFNFLLADQYVNHQLDSYIIKVIHSRFLGDEVPTNAKLSDYKLSHLMMFPKEHKQIINNLPKGIIADFVKEHPQWTYSQIQYYVIKKGYKIADFLKYYAERI